MFNDLATHDCGDCFVFVGKLFNLSFKDVLSKIAFDFGLSSLEISAEKTKIQNTKKVVTKASIKIGVKSRKWLIKDAKFWNSFGIQKQTLINYNVIPVKYIFFNENIHKTSELTYAYVEFKDNKTSYKIYQPFNIIHKWINNANYTVHQGYTNLPSVGKLLIITKSLKDVMSIKDVLNIPSVGLQSESVIMKDSVMDEYKSRFEKVICLFDNDKAGKNLSVEFTERYSIPHFFMPELKDVTDFSDLVKKVGPVEAKKIFNELII